MVIGTFSTVFGVIIAVLVFVLGLQVWQQYKLREKAEKETEAIVKIAKEMTELKSKQQELFQTTLDSFQKQVVEVGKTAKEVKTISASTQGERDKVERISKEIEQKAKDLRGSAMSLGNISLGSISASAVIEPYSKNIRYVSALDEYNVAPLSTPQSLVLKGTPITFDNILTVQKKKVDEEK